MQNYTETLTEQFKQFTDSTTKSLEPMKVFAGITSEAAEKMARHNYAVMGDFIDYATKSVHIPLSNDTMQDIASAQMAEMTSFAELMNTRAAEYAELAQSFTTKAYEAAETATASYK